MALYGELPCFFVVSTIECRSMKASAPWSDRKHPEFFNLIFNFRIPRSEALLSGGIAGSRKKIEDIVPAFEQAVPERGKLFVQLRQIFVN